MATDLYHYTLKSISFVQSDDQTLAFQRRIKSWMDQWTVANNYDSIVSADSYPIAAVKVWRKKFLDSANSALSDLPKSDLEATLAEAIYFKVECAKVILEGETSYFNTVDLQISKVC